MEAAKDLSDELGYDNVRWVADSFQIEGPRGKHDILVMKPLGMSLRTFQDMQKDGVFGKELVSSALDQVLLGLSFLHETGIVHTGKLCQYFDVTAPV